MPDATVVEVRAQSARPGWRVNIGGLHGLRDETTAMRLHDQRGRTYAERARKDARDQFPDRFSGADVAVFDSLPDDAGALLLEVPYVCAVDHTTSVEMRCRCGRLSRSNSQARTYASSRRAKRSFRGRAAPP